MQSRHHDGSYGPLKPFSEKEMFEDLKKPNVEHVEVFEGTEEQIKYRQKLFKSNKRYQKVKAIKPKLDLKLQIKLTENKKR